MKTTCSRVSLSHFFPFLLFPYSRLFSTECGLLAAVVGDACRGFPNALLDCGSRARGEILDERVDLRGIGDALEGHEVRGKASDVG